MANMLVNSWIANIGPTQMAAHEKLFKHRKIF